MTRVSLKEAYDNKDVVAQIFAIKDTANGAEETANNASTTANEAKTHVDTVAVDVERAVTTANNASASAQESARVVAGYDARLTTAEDGVARNRSDIQTIDGEITDIYNDLTNVVRKVGDAGQVIQNGLTLRGDNRAPNTTVGELNDLIVNAKRLIEEIESKLNSYEPMLRNTGNQLFDGLKTARQYPMRNQTVNAQNVEGWHELYHWNASSNTANQLAVFVVRFKQVTNGFGILLVDLRATATSVSWLVKGPGVPDNSVILARKFDEALAHLFVSGYRLEAECWGCTRATSQSLVEVMINPNSEDAVDEPTTAEYDSVVKI